MRVLVIGAAGQLGHDLLQVLKPGHDVIGIDIDEVDIADFNSVNGAVHDHNPDLVINCAAYTNVDNCERDRELAWSVNATGAGNSATACRERDIPLIHISTDYVFDGGKGEPYLESDPTAPLGEYGRGKLAGEEQVREALPDHLIVRTAWLFGATGHNFVKTMLKLGRVKEQLQVVDDQTGSPTYTGHLAAALKQLAETRLDQPGVYHMTNGGQCTWFDFAAEIFKLAGVAVDLLPTTTAAFGSPAPRPAYSVLANTRAPEIELPPWRQGLIECLIAMGELSSKTEE